MSVVGSELFLNKMTFFQTFQKLRFWSISIFKICNFQSKDCKLFPEVELLAEDPFTCKLF